MASVVGLLGSIAAFVKVRYLHDKAVIDNPIFRLHYRFTSAVLFGACILVTAFDLFGKRIECIMDDTTRADAIATYCWIRSTFTLVNKTDRPTLPLHLAHLGPAKFDIPGVGPENENYHDRVYHNYYQWVPFVLFLQGILFYLPHWIWKHLEAGRIKNMTDGCRGKNFGADASGRQSKVATVIAYLKESSNSHGRLAAAYVVCEALNFANAVGHMYFINRFLNNAFMDFGVKVAAWTETDQEDRDDPMIQMFPRMTKCTFEKYGPSGTLMKIDSLCVLPLNNIHEKVYIFLWFWLVILSILTGLAVVYRALTILIPRIRLYSPTSIASGGRMNPMAMVYHLPYGDYFLLHMLGKNLQGFLFKGVIQELADQEPEFKRPLHLQVDAEVERNLMTNVPTPKLTKFNITE